MTAATKEAGLTSVARIALAWLAATGFLVGTWAAFAPRSFFDEFPGLGGVWVAPDGPYNEHLVRDVGALNLALGVLAVGAFLAASRALLVTTSLAWLAYGGPHIVYHLRHLGPFDGTEAAGLVGTLALVVVAPLALLGAARSRVP